MGFDFEEIWSLTSLREIISFFFLQSFGNEFYGEIFCIGF